MRGQRRTGGAAAMFFAILLGALPAGRTGIEYAPLGGALPWCCCARQSMPSAKAPGLRLSGGGEPPPPTTFAGNGWGVAASAVSKQSNRKNKLPKRSREKAAARKQKRIASKAVGANDGASTGIHQNEHADFDHSGDVTRFARLSARDESQHSDNEAPSTSESADAGTGFGDGANLFQMPGAAGKGGGGFDPFEKDREAAPVEFDGVFDLENGNVSDPAVLRQLMQDMSPSIEKAYGSLGEVAEVANALREIEVDMEHETLRQDEAGLLQLLQKKSAVHASYMQHLYLYCLLKLEGEWFPTHWVASNLREIRLMMLHIEKEEKSFAPQMVEALHRYSADATAQEEAMDAGTGSGSQSVSAANDEEREQPPRPAIHAARAGPEDLKRLGGAQDTGRGSVDGGSGRTKRSATELDDGTDAAARKAGGGSDVLSQRGVDARQVPWRPGDEESCRGQPPEYWQQLFWEAVRMQDEVKAGNLEPTEEQRLFLEQLPFFEGMWEASFDGGMEEGKMPSGNGAGGGAQVAAGRVEGAGGKGAHVAEESAGPELELRMI